MRIYQHDPAMDDLPSALDWLQEHWDEQRPAAVRLHDANTTEGELGAPRFSGQFAAGLDWSPRTVVAWPMTASCWHPLSDGNPRICPECAGSGYKEVTVDRFPYPMTSALLRLALTPRHHSLPHPFEVVHRLAAFGWSARSVAAHDGLPWETAEAWYLRCIRKLRARYSAGPVATAWTAKSESQQQAELATV